MGDKMEAQLEILCRQSNESNIPNPTNPCHNPSWLGTTIQFILTKMKELTKPEKHIGDEWDIPYGRIRMFREDFHRSGSQGQVFYGLLSNNPVAVKQVKDVSLTKIRHLRELDHNNVIKFKGVSEQSNHYYIIMEWCPYGTLHDHIHNGKQLSSTLLSDFTVQIASGMKYLHAKNIIHRDLKPSNILLTHNDVLKISDFGTHKVFNDKISKTSKTYTGTCAYMAPEVIRGESYSFPIDIWSFGVVVWEILIGEEPYKDLDSSTVVWAVGNDSFGLPTPTGFPEGFTRVLEGCWKANPDERLRFDQVCMILKGAVQEVSKIRKNIWLTQQASWKREVRTGSNKMNLMSDSSKDQLAPSKARKKKHQEEERNNRIYLELQECFLNFHRDRQQLQREFELREEDVAKREDDVTKREEDFAKLQGKYNQLREQMSMMVTELNRKGIVLDINYEFICNDDK